jgi:hypothetical protein
MSVRERDHITELCIFRMKVSDIGMGARPFIKCLLTIISQFKVGSVVETRVCIWLITFIPRVQTRVGWMWLPAEPSPFAGAPEKSIGLL